ncbi:MFS transporter [Kitasatospora sp. NPDC001225]
MHPLLVRPEFRRYLAGQTLSVLGDSALSIALGIWAKVLTGSNSAAGLVLFCFSAPLLLLPLGGLLADRVRRKPLLVGVNLAVALSLLPLLLVDGRDTVWIIYCTATVCGLAGAVLAPAQSALLRSILTERQDFGAAAGLTQSARAGTTLVAPLLGSGLYGWFGGHVVAVADLVVLLLAALSFLTLRVEEVKPEPSGLRWRTEVLAGFVHLRGSVGLRPLVAATAASGFVLSLLQPVLFALTQHGLHRSPQFLGVLETTEAVGALAGSVVGGLLIGRLGPRRTVMAGSAVFGLGTVLLLAPSLYVVSAGLVIAGAGIPAAMVGLATAAQASTPPQLMGRAQAAVNLSLTAPQALAVGVGSGLVAALDFRVVLGVMVVGALLASAHLIGKPEAPTEPPEPEGPDADADTDEGDGEGEGDGPAEPENAKDLQST